MFNRKYIFKGCISIAILAYRSIFIMRWTVDVDLKKKNKQRIRIRRGFPLGTPETQGSGNLGWFFEYLPSLKLTIRTWKWMVGRRSFPFGNPYFQVQSVSFKEGVRRKPLRNQIVMLTFNLGCTPSQSPWGFLTIFVCKPSFEASIGKGGQPNLLYMDVSKNRGGPPKWMVKIMENPINKWMIWG